MNSGVRQEKGDIHAQQDKFAVIIGTIFRICGRKSHIFTLAPPPWCVMLNKMKPTEVTAPQNSVTVSRSSGLKNAAQMF